MTESNTEAVPRFLVVDDDADTRMLIQAILHSVGCEVALAEDGTKALDLVSTPAGAGEFDAIFLDIMMPGLSGYDVLQKLKEKDLTASIPVIMLTAKGGSDEIITGYKVGADYYIPKPFTKAQIMFGLDLVLTEESGKARVKTTVIPPE